MEESLSHDPVAPSFISQVWFLILDLCGHNHFILCCFLPFVSLTIFYWSFVAFFSFLDITGKPKFLAKYKIQPEKNRPIDKEKFKRALALGFFNQFVIGFAFALSFPYAATMRGISTSPILPSFWDFGLRFLGYMVCEEIWFYFSHRALHIPFLYKHIHKMHHEWTSPCTAASLYAHPLEHILSVNLAGIIGPILLGGHIFSITIWILFAIYINLIDHSGFHLPYVYSNEHHDFHHHSFVCNFSNFGILDKLMGTDEAFVKAEQFKNHRVLLTTESTHERFERLYAKSE